MEVEEQAEVAGCKRRFLLSVGGGGAESLWERRSLSI